MATNPTNTPDRIGSSLLDTLAAMRQQLGIGLLIVGLALTAIPIVFLIRQGWTTAWEVILWGALLSAACLIAGAVCLVLKPGPNLTDVEQVRLVLLILGGVVGFLTTLLGLVLPMTRYADVFGGGLKEWSKNAWTVWLCAAAVFGGLGLMFLSLLLARGVERTNAVMRRLMYGYNAFFSSFLLLAVLLLVNVLGYSPLPAFASMGKTYDWTANQVYTLSAATKSQLADLKKPVHVIVLLSGRSEALPAMESMLNNCREVTPNLTWELKSPEMLDRVEQFDLRRKYELPQDMEGMVVVYGTDQDATFTFVKESELYQGPTPTFGEQPTSTKFTFKGEAALTTAIDFLQGGKSKTVIYFTQGHGELSFGPEGEEGNGSVSTLIDNLGGGNYELRPLPLGPTTKEIPSDANLVVIARPRSALPAPAVDALRAYTQGTNGKPGKLIALLNPGEPGGPSYQDQGLEGLLGEYGVVLNHDRVLTPNPNAPTLAPVMADPNSANSIARVFTRIGADVTFRNAQTLEIRANPKYRAETLFETDPEYLPWDQKDLRADPAALAVAAVKEAEQRKFDRFAKTPLPVAVGVSEAQGAPPIPGHEFMGPQPGKPVLAVYGDGNWISNETLAGPDPRIPYNLFKSTVDWLRERATIGEQVKSKSGTEREEFSLAKITPTSAWGIEWWSGWTMLAAVVALGLGMVLVRRR